MKSRPFDFLIEIEVEIKDHIVGKSVLGSIQELNQAHPSRGNTQDSTSRDLESPSVNMNWNKVAAVRNSVTIAAVIVTSVIDKCLEHFVLILLFVSSQCILLL